MPRVSNANATVRSTIEALIPEVATGRVQMLEVFSSKLVGVYLRMMQVLEAV